MKAAPEASTRSLGGRYELGEPIGRGGMGVVYAARDRRLDRPVAVKLLEDRFAEHHAEREARAAARLVHPNVVVVLDVGEDRGRPFIVMERVEGVTLADELSDGPIGVDPAVEMGREVLAALGAAHAMGIVHGDVKPGNVLRARDRWKVADFGIARFVDTDTTGTISGYGSPSYAAPERFDAKPATERGDIYGLGVVMYEALAGAKPFVGDDGWAVAVAVREGRFEPLQSRRPDLDPRLCEVVERAMSRNPSDRFGSAEEMASALPLAAPRPRAEPTVRIPPLEATAVLPDVAAAELAGVPADEPPATATAPVTRVEPAQVAVAEPTSPILLTEPEVASRTATHTRERPPWLRTAAVVVAVALALLIATLGLSLVGRGEVTPARARVPSLTPSVPATVSPAPTGEPSPAFGGNQSQGGGEDQGNGNHNGFENGQGNKHGED